MHYIFRIDNWIQIDKEYRLYGFGLLCIKGRHLLSVSYRPMQEPVTNWELDILWLHIIN